MPNSRKTSKFRAWYLKPRPFFWITIALVFYAWSFFWCGYYVANKSNYSALLQVLIAPIYVAIIFIEIKEYGFRIRGEGYEMAQNLVDAFDKYLEDEKKKAKKPSTSKGAKDVVKK